MSPEQREALEAIIDVSAGLRQLAISSGSDGVARLVDRVLLEARRELGHKRPSSRGARTPAAAKAATRRRDGNGNG